MLLSPKQGDQENQVTAGGARTPHTEAALSLSLRAHQGLPPPAGGQQWGHAGFSDNARRLPILSMIQTK